MPDASSVLSPFELMALLLTLAAAFSWLNHRVVRMPHSVGLLVMGLLAALAVTGAGAVFPGSRAVAALTGAVRQIDFTEFLMNGLLAFLLFAGALQLDVGRLRERAAPVLVLSVIGTVLSTAIVGLAFWAAAGALGRPLGLAWALVFGALISPTDPVAVLAVLKGVRLPPEVEVELQGEALFNDGVGVVLFVLLLGHAAGASSTPPPSFGSIATSLLHEVGGGLALGLVAGHAASRALRAVDDFAIETLVTPALVTGLYALAQRLGASGPLAVVAAGLWVGHRAPRAAVGASPRRSLTTLWALVDEILNAVLFVLIGLEVLVLDLASSTLWIALAAVPIAFVARLIAVAAPIALFPSTRRLSMRNVPFLTWAGVRGGISVALALALPAGPPKELIVAATYAVVLFTLIVQGSTVGAVAARTLGRR